MLHSSIIAPDDYGAAFRTPQTRLHSFITQPKIGNRGVAKLIAGDPTGSRWASDLDRPARAERAERFVHLRDG